MTIYAENMRAVATTLLLLTAATLVAGDCPVDKIRKVGHCSYSMVCVGTMSDIRLHSDCQGSSNYDVKIDVVLQNASETFHTGTDPEFLAMITSLTVHGNWPRADLPFLENMYRLRELHVVNNNIQQVFNSPFRNLINIENIDLSHNQIANIEEIFQFETRPFKVKAISLAYNTIVEVPRYTFEELSSLRELDLSHNYIRELKDEPFCNLTNLQVLKLNNNKIRDLNGALHNLYSLRHLYLTSNEIQKIDMESINTINHLETFDISKNLIEIIDPTLFPRHWNHFSNHTVCKIVLSDNYVVKVPNVSVEVSERFRRHSKNFVFTKLNLSNNSISDIEYNAFSLMQLISIDLSNNKLTDFIVNADDLVYVQYLNLSSNFLYRLYYESFSSMHSLQNFDLSHNYMENFPDQSLSNTYGLKYVNFTFNDIIELHSLKITFHPEGGYLDLSNNGLSTLTIPEHEAVGLRELVLSSNNISDAYLIQLAHQHNLNILDMSKNSIDKLEGSSLQLPEKLGSLDMSFNRISTIAQSSFKKLPNLKTLRLSHNQLKIINYGVFDGLTNLQNLDLSFNLIAELDSKVFMDLKSLSVLSLRNNGLNALYSDGWLSHMEYLMVYIDGNNLSCDWLAKVLNDFERGYSKMYPKVLESGIVGNDSIQGIPCKQEVGYYIGDPNYKTDERLLITSQKILEAVQEQTSLLKRFMRRAILQIAEQRNDINYV